MLPQSKCPCTASRYPVLSQADDKALRGRNLSDDVVAGMAGHGAEPYLRFVLEGCRRVTETRTDAPYRGAHRDNDPTE